MNGEAIISISAAVVALTQMLKWGNVIPDKWGPVAVMLLAAIGTGIWAYSQGDFQRASAFAYFAGWVSVSLAAAGVFGFTRAASNAVSSASPPPASGAGSSPTVKE